MKFITLFACLLLSSGCSHLNKQQANRTPQEAKNEYSVFGSSDSFRPSSFKKYGNKNLFSTHPSEDNQVAILDNGDDSFAVRVQALERAKKSIRIQALIFTGDESGRHIAEILKRKKREGLDVRVIVDALSNPKWGDQMLYYDLQREGIPVEGYEALFLQWVRVLPPMRKMLANVARGKKPMEINPERSEIPYHPLNANRRYHEKIWIIDAETDDAFAVTGGLNIANEYFRVTPEYPIKYWRDQDVAVRGAVIKDMAKAFDRTFKGLWDEKRNRFVNFNQTWRLWNKLLRRLEIRWELRPKLREEFVSRVASMAQKQVELAFYPAQSRFFQNQTRLDETFISQAYMALINDARHEILIGNAYFIPSRDFIEGLKNAVRRGVRVVLLTNCLETNDLPEITIVGRHYYKDLLEVNYEDSVIAIQESGSENDAGIEIWEWQGKEADQEERTQGTIHAKYAVFDRQVSLVGSHNLDPRSEKHNSESALVFQNAELGSYLAENRFTRNDLLYSRKISYEESETFRKPKGVSIYKLRKLMGQQFEDLL